MNRGSEPLDRGLLLGDGLFETVLIRGGTPFRLDRHLERLMRGCERTGIPFPHELGDRIEACLDGGLPPQPPPHAALRITVTRGPGEGLAPPADPRAGLHVTLREIGRPPPEERPALTARIAGRIDERALSSGLKCTGYLERIMALSAARAAGNDEAILLNSEDRLVEGSASNLFWMKGGRLHTPTVAEGALPGVTREAILELARDVGIPIAPGRGAPTHDEALQAEEILLTSSLRGPIALVRLDGEAIGRGEWRGRPGPVFLRLARLLETLIDRETSASRASR